MRVRLAAVVAANQNELQRTMFGPMAMQFVCVGMSMTGGGGAGIGGFNALIVWAVAACCCAAADAAAAPATVLALLRACIVPIAFDQDVATSSLPLPR
jgi:hypothetical protein